MNESPENRKNGFDKKIHEQNILLKISRSIINTMDYQKVLQIISDGMSEMLEIETAAIYLLEKEETLYLGATTPPLDPQMPDDLRTAFLKDHPHIRKTVLTRLPQIIPDTKTANLSAAEKIVVELRKLRSLLYFPFIQEEHVLGVLILGTTNKSRIFTREEIDLGQTIANQLSIGIQNARLHHDLQIKNKRLLEEIDERKKVEYALRKSEAQLSNSHRIAKLGHWEYDVKSDEFTFADEFFEIYHTNVKNTGGYTMNSREYASNFVHPEDRHMVRQEIEKAIETKDENFSVEIEHRIIYAEGNIGYVIVRYIVIKDEIWNTTKILGVNQDITKQKQIEKELKNHKDNLEKLVLEKTRKLDTVIEELKSANDELLDKNKIINIQNKELKATLKNLRETQARLIQAEKMASLGVLTAGVAHEINNPLNYIMGSYLALTNYFETIESINREYVDNLMNSLKIGLDKATTIVKGLNQFSRESKTQNEDCNIRSIIENCLTMLNNQIAYRIEIEKQFSEENIFIKGNIGQLHQAFLNILLNSVQALEAEGKITLFTKRKGNSVKIKISDTGVGISKENLPRITDPFFTTKEPGKGTGLGLSITYSIIRDHHGRLEFESEPGIGTTITIVFPI